MDKLERDQVRLLLEHLDEEFRRKSAGRQKAMHAEHSAKGLLRSGATVKVAVRIAEEEASAYVKKAVLDVADVAQDMAAFALIQASLIAMFRGWEDEVGQAVRLATAGGGGRMDSVSSAANNLFAEMKARIERELEIHRFTFIRTTRGDMASLIPSITDPPRRRRSW